MLQKPSSPPLTLQALRNARTRIYAVDAAARRSRGGKHPGMGPVPPSPRNALPTGAPGERLIRRDWLDRLQPPLTRFRE